MTDNFIFMASILVGGIVYKLCQPYQHLVYQNLEGNHSRVANHPVGSDIHRQAGDDLFRSGHPDEVVLRTNLKPLNLSQVQSRTAQDLQKNNTLMTQDHFNNSITRRKTYASVDNSIGYPSLNMGSGWYVKTVNANRYHKPEYVKTF